MTTGTITAAGTAGSCCYQAVIVGARIGMTGGTGVMDRVVRRIYGETASNGCIMAAGAVGSQRYTTGGDVVDAMRTGVSMTGLTRITSYNVCYTKLLRCET